VLGFPAVVRRGSGGVVGGGPMSAASQVVLHQSTAVRRTLHAVRLRSTVRHIHLLRLYHETVHLPQLSTRRRRQGLLRPTRRRRIFVLAVRRVFVGPPTEGTETFAGRVGTALSLYKKMGHSHFLVSTTPFRQLAVIIMYS